MIKYTKNHQSGRIRIMKVYSIIWWSGAIFTGIWILVYCPRLIVQVGDPNNDHQCWERPEDMDTSRTAYKVDASHPGSDVAAETAAAFASASMALRAADQNYSAKLLNSAKQVSAENVLCHFQCLNRMCAPINIHILNICMQSLEKSIHCLVVEVTCWLEENISLNECSRDMV